MTTEAILAPFRLHDYQLGQVIDPVLTVGDDTVESAIDGFRVKIYSTMIKIPDNVGVVRSRRSLRFLRIQTLLDS